MAVNTYDMAPAMTGERTDERSDMFAQSSALYGRINRSANRGMSPWMIIAPVALAVLAGGALIATTGSHPKQAARTVANAPAAQALTSAPTSVATAPELPTQALRVTAAPRAATHPVGTVPTRALSHRTTATDHVTHTAPAQPAVAPAPGLTTVPTPIVPAPAPDPAPASTAPPAADPAPASPPGI